MDTIAWDLLMEERAIVVATTLEQGLSSGTVPVEVFP
jgi:hypothetical protein